MKKLLLLIVSCCLLQSGISQTNIISTNPIAQQILLGNYNPLTYSATVVISNPDSLSRGINKRVSKDSLHALMEELRFFGNRNTGADTNSNKKGIGAARRWAYKKFQQYSQQNENRLITSYLQFDYAICSINQHKNIYAVLPGSDTTDKSIVLIEGHIDSRCAVLCDTSCLAEGMEDNGSGTALVLELARVMSRYTYKNTIVFMLTIAEEQGLYGAEAFANYAIQNGIKVKAVLNNDVIGGVFCGNSSSAPSCPGYGSIDSTHVRLFSYGGYSSLHKGLARFIKLEYKEMLSPYVKVPMTLNIMTPEDRTGRGGDHIPFRKKNITAMRFTSANENGDANVANVNYKDRQHTSGDILGLDTNNDQLLDSFFVNFNYLARNAVINGNAAAMAAIGPKTPDFTMVSNGLSIVVTLTTQTQYAKYRVGLRTTTYDWDTVYTCIAPPVFTLNVSAPNNYIASVASVDNNNVESLFSKELTVNIVGINEPQANSNNIELLQNKPNPSDEATMITVKVNRDMLYKKAWISILDLEGREIKKMPIVLKVGMNEVEFNHGYHATGIYTYTLFIDGEKIQSRKMIFTN